MDRRADLVDWYVPMPEKPPRPNPMPSTPPPDFAIPETRSGNGTTSTK
jgi:hypothetical protein